ncbi:MAG: ATP-binding protein [Chloroflexi bacterium]|nr:ATP-binding protein [Chloroflexota bacterium]
MLDFCIAAWQREEAGEEQRVGLELWQVGLIPDAREDFDHNLLGNRRAVRLLVQPQKVVASARDRIASLKVHTSTALELERFFAPRLFSDVRGWARALAAGEGPTIDAWVFPDTVYSDLESIHVKSFMDPHGALFNTYRPHLEQPHGPGGALQAAYGPGQWISVSWETEPARPSNVHTWRVALVPAGSQDDETDDAEVGELTSRKVRGSNKTARLKLELELDETPEERMCVRLVALDEDDGEILDKNGNPITATSDEFYLTNQPVTVKSPGPRRNTVLSLAEGRLAATFDSKLDTITLAQPNWVSGRETLTYFTVRANERTLLSVAASTVLLWVERKTLNEPASGGRYRLDLDEVRLAQESEIVSDPVQPEAGDWVEFWRARSNFFERLRRSGERGTLESADWTTDLTSAALRYSQAYRDLLAQMEETGGEALRDALTVDTLQIRCRGNQGLESAVVVLPTHPLRVAWFCAHASLLRLWEEALLKGERPQRRNLIDIRLIREVAPANMPAFIPGGDGSLYVFFQNLGFYHGVALPPSTADPRRRFLDLATMLGFGDQANADDDRLPVQLARHLREFRALHRYADPLQLALINPDHGEFLARALDGLLPRTMVGEEDDAEPATLPALDVTAYVVNEQATKLSGLDRWRGRQFDFRPRRPTDFLQPALATTVRPIESLTAEAPRTAHVAVAADLSRPSVQAVVEETPDSMLGSLSLYGLVARFISASATDDSAVRWTYRIVPTGTVDKHPAGPRFGDTLIDTQTAMLRACGRLVDPKSQGSIVPALAVRLDREQAAFLETLHQLTDWVITMDRFFGIEYFDSPNIGPLEEASRKYLIDYSPEFIEGLGHRMVVTTVWREEVLAVLRRAMGELGFATVDRSVGQLLQYLKTVSGRLALQAMGHQTSAAAAVSLGAVTAWLQAGKRLSQVILVPIDAHRELFWPGGTGPISEGERRCDLLLVGFRRNIVDATFVEVKWRTTLGDVGDLSSEMAEQMLASGNAIEDRFFNNKRVDGPLQRAYLANVLRFYCERARRYGLMDEQAVENALRYLAQFERSGIAFRPSYEGYIVSLNDPGRPEYQVGNCTIRVLTARDFERTVTSLLPPSVVQGVTAPIVEMEAPTSADGYTQAVAAVPASGVRESGDGNNPPAASAAVLLSSRPPTGTGGAEQALSPTEPPPVVQPKAMIEVTLGESSGKEVVWRPSVQGSPHLFITGIPGQGKSWTVLRLLSELARQGVPALSFDFHGQLGAVDSPYRRTAEPVVLDAAEGLPFSPFECSTSLRAASWDATALAVAEIFDYVCRLGDIQRDVLFQCIRDAYRAFGFGGTSEGDEPTEYPTLQDVLHRLERAEQQRHVQNVLARCRPLLEMDLFRPPVGSRNNVLDSIQRGLVVDLHNLSSANLQLATGAFLLRKIYTDMFGWGMADRLRLVVVLDEAHRLARDVTLPNIMKEGRKFGVAVVVASQGLADFHPDVLNNVGTKIAFRANHTESRKIAGFFQGRSVGNFSSVLEGLGVGRALVQTAEMSAAAVVRMRPVDQP